MEIIPREEWTKYRATLDPIRLPTARAFIHHTVSTVRGGVRASRADEAAFMRETEAYHIRVRKFDAIAYSFVVMPSGGIYEGRGWGHWGAHTKGWNDRSHAWCFAGNFERYKPSQAALEACARHIGWGIEQGRLTRDVLIAGHREAPGNSTACPGKYLQAKVDEIAQWAREVDEVTEDDRKKIVADVVAALKPEIARWAKWSELAAAKSDSGEPSSYLLGVDAYVKQVEEFSHKAILEQLRAGGTDPKVIEDACVRAVRRVFAEAGGSA